MAGVQRRNSNTPSLRQFINSASPLIEEASDEEKDDKVSDEDDDEDAELSENPVSSIRMDQPMVELMIAGE